MKYWGGGGEVVKLWAFLVTSENIKNITKYSKLFILTFLSLFSGMQVPYSIHASSSREGLS